MKPIGYSKGLERNEGIGFRIDEMNVPMLHLKPLVHAILEDYERYRPMKRRRSALLILERRTEKNKKCRNVSDVRLASNKLGIGDLLSPIHWLSFVVQFGHASQDFEPDAALSDAEVAKRAQAAEELAQLGSEARPAAVALVLACGDEAEEVRQWATSALEEMGPPEASDVGPLISFIEAKSPDVGYWAATLLGRLKADAAPL